MTDDTDGYVNSIEDIQRAEELASMHMDHLVSHVELARLDPTATAMFLLADLFASLQVFSGYTPDAALKQIRNWIGDRVEALRCMQNGEEPLASLAFKPNTASGAATLH